MKSTTTAQSSTTASTSTALQQLENLVIVTDKVTDATTSNTISTVEPISQIEIQPPVKPAISTENMTKGTVTEKIQKKGQRKGKTAIMTGDQYMEELKTQKIKIKKEKVEKKNSKPRIISNVDVSIPIKTTRTIKRKAPSSLSIPKKRKPLSDVNNQNTIDSQLLHVPQENAFPLQNQVLLLDNNFTLHNVQMPYNVYYLQDEN